MKVIRHTGEKLFFLISRKAYGYFGACKFSREVLGKNQLRRDYSDVKKKYTGDQKYMHGDMTNPQYYFKCIDEVLAFQETDNVVDIGCGEGTIDSYICVNNLYGIDISPGNIENAKKKNPNYEYHEQNFIDEMNLPDDISYNKCFSYGVFQYCKPEDVEKLIKNSIDTILRDGLRGGVKMIAHLDVPDIEKAYDYYHRAYGITERFFAKHKKGIKMIFSDGSYWHDMRDIKKKCIKYIKDKGVDATTIVYVSDCNCNYRSNLVMLFISN